MFCRIGKHVGEFESIFLSDLDGGQLPSRTSYCGLEGSYLCFPEVVCKTMFDYRLCFLPSTSVGELWMNLDGEISPICLNILPLASSSQ